MQTLLSTLKKYQMKSQISDTYGTIGISRTLIDNSDLESSSIARYDCIVPGTTAADTVDPDFLVGLGPGYGYSKVLLSRNFTPVKFVHLLIQRCIYPHMWQKAFNL